MAVKITTRFKRIRASFIKARKDLESVRQRIRKGRIELAMLQTQCEHPNITHTKVAR